MWLTPVAPVIPDLFFDLTALGTVGGNVSWHNQYEEQHGDSSKLKRELPCDQSFSGYISKGNENRISKRHLQSHLFTIAKVCKQPMSPSMGEWIKTWCIHTMEYYSVMRKKEINLSICNNIDGPWGYHAKWNKSGRERQILYDVTSMWNLKKSNS